MMTRPYLSLMNIFNKTEVNEVDLCKEALADLLDMYRNVPSIKIARDAFLSMTLCGPFTFSIPKFLFRKVLQTNSHVENTNYDAT